MTILEAITKIQNVKPNQYDDELMVEWLSDLDGMIYHEYIKWHLKPKALPEKAPLGDMSWADILAVANAGEAKEYFNTHDTKTIYFDEPVLGSDSIVVEIAGFDYDDLADGSGKAPISFLMKDMFAERSKMHDSSTTVLWPETYFYTTVLPALRNAIVNAVGPDVISPVIKTSAIYATDEKASVSVTVWQPSLYEVSQSSYVAEEAPTGIDYCYPIFDALDDSTRVKYWPRLEAASSWWVRTCSLEGYNNLISSSGEGRISDSTSNMGIVLGFCVGKVERAKWPYDPELDMDTTLLVPEPYSNLYVKYLAAQVDYFNGEIARYNNSMIMFNTALSAFADWYNRSNMPNQDNFIRF